MRKYSLVKNLLNEVVTHFDTRDNEDKEFPAIPVDSVDNIYLDRLNLWDNVPSRYWEEDYYDWTSIVLGSLNAFFRKNPIAGQYVRDNISNTIATKGKKISSALPIHEDDNPASEARMWMYMGMITPTSRMKSIKGFMALLSAGGTAEENFKNYLISLGYNDAKVVGGGSNPDVVASGLKFEVGTGDNKRLWLGSVNGVSDDSVVKPRRNALDKHWDGKSQLSSEAIKDIWLATGYDFLIKGDKGNFKAFALNRSNDKIGEQFVETLGVHHCWPQRVKMEDGGYTILYGSSLDWEYATTLE